MKFNKGIETIKEKRINRNSGAEDFDEVKNSIENITRRVNQSEKRISEIEDRNFEITQSEDKKRIKKK